MDRFDINCTASYFDKTAFPSLTDSLTPSINVYSANDLSYEEFLRDNLLKNFPCVIKNINIQKYGQNWVSGTGNEFNFDYLIKTFGDTIVPVANCGNKYYNAQKKEDKTLKEFINYWKSYISSSYSEDLPCYYLKDWHFTRDFPEENLYRVPRFFSSDWLNEYFTIRKDIKDDYRFVYMGPKGSWTPFHVDVFTSFSWSVNLCGKKRWVLFPPGQESFLTDKYGNLVYDVESETLKDKSLFENYFKLKDSFEITQNANEAIFVPSGWHHQVWNLEDTISVNHNWVNGCNIGKMWISLQANLEAVKKEISDCKDMEGWENHCQVMLNATYGIDYLEFCRFLLYIVRVRLKHLSENKYLEVYGDWLLGPNHLKFDIMQIKHILVELLSNCDFLKLNYSLETRDLRTLLEEIEIVVDKK